MVQTGNTLLSRDGFVDSRKIRYVSIHVLYEEKRKGCMIHGHFSSSDLVSTARPLHQSTICTSIASVCHFHQRGIDTATSRILYIRLCLQNRFCSLYEGSDQVQVCMLQVACQKRICQCFVTGIYCIYGTLILSAMCNRGCISRNLAF